MILKIKWNISCFIKSFLSIFIINKKIKNSKNTIVVVSNALNEGGAPIVLYEAICILRKKYDVVLVSPDIGPIGKKCKKQGITVLCSRYFNKIIKIKILSQKWKLIFVNTLVMCDWILDIDEKNLCIWWIHEGLTYAQKYKDKIKNVKESNNIKIYCGGEWAKKNMNLFGLKTEDEVLYYGSKDIISNDDNSFSRKNGELNFLLVGSICERKKTLDLIRAIKNIPKGILSKLEFTIIGKSLSGEEDYYYKFLEELGMLNKKIEYIKSVPHDELFKQYKKCDVVLALSDDDPLPVAVTEAFILKKCVLISSNCGQYHLIKNGFNGYTFIARDINDLSNKIIDIYNNKNKLDSIGKESRKLYEKYFTVEAFENKFTKIINESIGDDSNHEN